MKWRGTRVTSKRESGAAADRSGGGQTGMTGEPHANGRTRLAILATAAGLVSAAIYLPALGAGFFSDDYEVLGRMAPTIVRPDFLFTVFYRDFNPFLHADFVVDWLAGGGASWVFHLTSIASHGLVVALIFLLAVDIGSPVAFALAAAVTWGVGARLSEAVIWPVARGHLFATLFPLAAILAVRRLGANGVPVAAGLFGLGLLSKETAFFPMLIAPWFAERGVARRRALITVSVLGGAFVALQVAIKTDLHTAGEGAWAAIRKLPFIVLRPIGMGDIYGFSAPGFALFAVTAVAVIFVAWRTPARICLIWILVCAAPILPLQKVSSRYLYLLSAGYPLAAGGLASLPAFARLSAWARRLTIILLGVLAACLVVANALLVQKEIEDYRLLGEPYASCLEALRPAAHALLPGETLVIVETAPHTAIPRLAALLQERRSTSKLLPERKNAVGGLIYLSDAINAVRPPGDFFAIPVDPVEPGPRRVYVWDGAQVFPAPFPPSGRPLAARLVNVDEFVRTARARRE